PDCAEAVLGRLSSVNPGHEIHIGVRPSINSDQLPVHAGQSLQLFLETRARRQSTKTRALRNRRNQPPSSPQPGGCHELVTVRNTLSGWGIMMVTRPSRLVRLVIPAGEPFGFAGYDPAGCKR